MIGKFAEKFLDKLPDAFKQAGRRFPNGFAKDIINEFVKQARHNGLELFPHASIDANMKAAVEFGYKQGEKGHNIQKTLENYEKLMRGEQIDN